MIVKGSKIELIKPMGVFDNIGDVCEVVNLTEDGVISFRFGGCHLGCMSYGEYEKYFKEYVEPVPVKREWSEWSPVSMEYTTMSGNNVEKTVQYRTDGKHTQIRTIDEDNNLKARSSCFKTDKFDSFSGLKLAMARLIIKLLNREVEKMAADM